MTSAISSLNATGSIATAQSTGTTIATISHSTQATQPGVYRVTAYVVLGGAPAAGDINNVVVTVGSATFTLPVQAVAGSSPFVRFMVDLDGSTDIVMKTGANSNTATYSGTLVADYFGKNGQLAKYFPA